jgi:hypothetical protein
VLDGGKNDFDKGFSFAYISVLLQPALSPPHATATTTKTKSSTVAKTFKSSYKYRQLPCYRCTRLEIIPMMLIFLLAIQLLCC